MNENAPASTQRTQFVQWDKTCSIDQTALTEYNVVTYISSLEWLTRDDVRSECNQLLSIYGRKLCTRSSSETKLLLKCVHAGQPRTNRRSATQTDATQNEDPADIQPVKAVLNEGKREQHLASNDSDDDPSDLTDSSDAFDTDEDEDDCDDQCLKQPKVKKSRKTTTGKIGCDFGIWFSLKQRRLMDGTVYSSWRVTSCCSIELRPDQSNQETGHSTTCQPIFRLKHGGILYMHQLTQPMIDQILMMHKGTIKPCQIRTAVQLEHSVPHIDFALIQNMINRGKPRKQQAETDELLNWLEHDSGVIHACQWQDAQLDGQAVQELRNLFWTNDQMLRMYHKYGQRIELTNESRRIRRAMVQSMSS